MSRLPHPLWSVLPIVAGFVAGCDAPARTATPPPPAIDAEAAARAAIVTIRSTRVLCEREACPSLMDVSIALRSSGATVVATERGIVELDSLGASHLVARSGAGPGELHFALALGVDTLERITAFDIGAGRQSRWSPAEPPAHVFTMPPQSMIGLRARNASLYALLLPAAAARRDTVSAVVLRHDFDSATVWRDTIATTRAPALFTVGGEGLFPPPLPWGWAMHWDVCPNGDVVLSANDRWRLERVRARTRRMTTDGQHVVSRAVTASERDALEKQPFLSRAAPSFRAALREEIARGPAVHPVVAAVFCGVGNDAWVGEPVTADSVVLRRIDDRGGLTGSLPLPRNVRVLALREPWIVVVETLPDDEQRLVRYTIDAARD